MKFRGKFKYRNVEVHYKPIMIPYRNIGSSYESEAYEIFIRLPQEQEVFEEFRGTVNKFLDAIYKARKTWVEKQDQQYQQELFTDYPEEKRTVLEDLTLCQHTLCQADQWTDSTPSNHQWIYGTPFELKGDPSGPTFFSRSSWLSAAGSEFDVTLSDILIQFITDNSREIEFLSEEKRLEFETHLGCDLPTHEEKESLEATKNIINFGLRKYQEECGNKFLFFSKSPDRVSQIEELTRMITPIFTDKSRLSIDDKKAIMTALISVRNQVIESHKQGSTAARWGITSSRLACEIDKSIKSLIKDGHITKDIKDECEASLIQDREPIERPTILI